MLLWIQKSPPSVATYIRLVGSCMLLVLPLLGVYALTNFGYFKGNRNKQREKRFGDLVAQLQDTGLHPNMIPGSPPEARALENRYYGGSEHPIDLTAEQLSILADMGILQNPKAIGPKVQNRAKGKKSKGSEVQEIS